VAAKEQEPVSYVLLSPPPTSLLDSPEACFNGQKVRLSAAISPPQSGILLQYVLAYTVTGANGAIFAPASRTGFLSTDAAGMVALTVTLLLQRPLRQVPAEHYPLCRASQTQTKDQIWQNKIRTLKLLVDTMNNDFFRKTTKSENYAIAITRQRAKVEKDCSFRLEKLKEFSGKLMKLKAFCQR
jgi:hypothetical protein